MVLQFEKSDCITVSGCNMMFTEMGVDVDPFGQHLDDKLTVRFPFSVYDSGNHRHRAAEVLSRLGLSPPVGLNITFQIVKSRFQHVNIVVYFLPFVNFSGYYFLFCNVYLNIVYREA